MALEPATIDGSGAAFVDENQQEHPTTDFSLRSGIPDGPATASYERVLLQPDDLRRRLKHVFSVIRTDDTDTFIDKVFEDTPAFVDNQRKLQLLDWEIGRRVVQMMYTRQEKEGITESKWPLPLLTERNRKSFTRLLRTIWNSNVSDRELSTVFSESKIIARGGYGLVTTPDAADVILKEIDLSQGNREKNEIRVKREEKSLRVLEQRATEISPKLFAQGAIDGQHVIVMERVPGKTLQDEVKNGDLETAYDKCLRSLEAVRSLIRFHQQGMVHRDIKPGNMMWVPKEGKVKIIDLGLVRTRHSDELDHEQEIIDQTCTLQVVEPIGTLEYMSPDQARNAAAFHPRNDAYSLGLSLYKIWTGEDPRSWMHKKIETQENGKKETPAEAVERKLGILRSERFREYLPKLRKLPAEIAMVIDVLLHRDPQFTDDPDWMQSLQREQHVQGLLEQFKKKGPSWFAPVRRYAGKLVSTLNRWKYKIAVGILLGTGLSYGIKKAIEPPPHLRIVETAEPPDTQFTRLSTRLYGNGVREPVILLPEDLEGKAWKFNRAVDFFIGNEYIGSEGVVEGEGVGNRGSVVSTHFYEGNESIVFMGIGIGFHRLGPNTHAHHHALYQSGKMPLQSQRSKTNLPIRDLDENSNMRKFFQRLQVRISDQNIRVETADEKMRKSMWGKLSDEEFVQRFTITIGRETVPIRPPALKKSDSKKNALAPSKHDLDAAALQLLAPYQELCTDELRQVLHAHRIQMNPMPDTPVDPQISALNTLMHQPAIGDASHLAIAAPESPYPLQKTVRKGRQPVG